MKIANDCNTCKLNHELSEVNRGPIVSSFLLKRLACEPNQYGKVIIWQ